MLFKLPVMLLFIVIYDARYFKYFEINDDMLINECIYLMTVVVTIF